MKNFNELEKVLLDQIEKLNDDSIAEDPDACRAMVERSKAISGLTSNLVEMNRLKLDVVNAAYKSDGLYDKYLGIEDAVPRE